MDQLRAIANNVNNLRLSNKKNAQLFGRNLTD
jgi:hypothetical protein